MESLRFKVVDEAFNRKADPVEIPSERPEKYYGKYVFNRQKMFEYLPADTYQRSAAQSTTNSLCSVKWPTAWPKG